MRPPQLPTQRHEDTKAPREPLPACVEEAGKLIVDAAYVVHRALGPGLLESVYEVCLAHECAKRGLTVERQVTLPITYDNITFDSALRLDLLVNRLVVVEAKAVEEVLPVHQAQVLTYLRLSKLRLGYLANFNVPLIRDGLHRVVL